MKKNNKISIYCLSYSDPASYYRIVQYTDSLYGEVKIRYFCPDYLFQLYMKYSKTKYKKIFVILVGLFGYFKRIFQMISDLYFYRPDRVFVSRTIYPKFSPIGLNAIENKFLVTYKNKILWDFDDNIYQSESSNCEFNSLAQYSYKILLTSEYLKNTLPISTHYKVICLPTTDRQFEIIDNNKMIEIRSGTYHQEFNLIWIGTHYSIGELECIMDDLDSAAFEILKKLNKKLNITVVSNIGIANKYKNITIINVKWSRNRVMEEIQKAHLGLMPLKENSFNLGKGGFKAIQYIGAALPVILSDVGYNKKVIIDEVNGYLISNNEWKEKLFEIAGNYDKWFNMSKNSRYIWMDKFSSEKNLKEIQTQLFN